MAANYPDYHLVNKDGDNLTYTKHLPAQSPNIAIAGCLFFLGIIPAIIFWLVAQQPSRTLTVQIYFGVDKKLYITSTDGNIANNLLTLYNNIQ